jgi:hypothetical protein
VIATLMPFLWAGLGAYLLGVLAVLWACPEPWVDRLAIAFGWPVALVYVAWRDL